MANRKTKSSVIDFTFILGEVIKEYGEEVEANVTRICREIAPNITNQLKQKSPKSPYAHEHYSEGWTYEVTTNKFGTVRITAYNSLKPQLTHLLENGHEVVAHGKHYGRTTGEKHIKPVQDWAIEEIMKEVKSEI